MKAIYKPDGMTRISSHDPEVIARMAEVERLAKQGAESLPNKP